MIAVFAANESSSLLVSGLDQYDSRLGFTMDYCMAVYLLIVWVVALYANGVVVLGLARQRRRLAALDIMVGNLALSNGMLSVVTYPMTVMSLTFHRWQFGISGCQAYGFIMLFFGLTAIWTLLGIAGVFHQTIKITKNVMSKIQQKQRRTWAFRFIALTYILSGALSLLPLIGVSEYVPAKHGISCTINWALHTVSSDVYITGLMLTGFGAPLVGTAALYTAITKVVFSVRSRGSYTIASATFAERFSAVQRKTFFMSLFVCICMIMAWTPYSIVSMWETYGDSATVPKNIEAVAAFTAKSSTAFSPLVHLCFTKKFRHWLKNFLLCCRVSDQRNCSHRDTVMYGKTTQRPTHTPPSSLRPSFLRYIDQVVNNDLIPSN